MSTHLNYTNQTDAWLRLLKQQSSINRDKPFQSRNESSSHSACPFHGKIVGVVNFWMLSLPLFGDSAQSHSLPAVKWPHTLLFTQSLELLGHLKAKTVTKQKVSSHLSQHPQWNSWSSRPLHEQLLFLEPPHPHQPWPADSFRVSPIWSQQESVDYDVRLAGADSRLKGRAVDWTWRKRNNQLGRQNQAHWTLISTNKHIARAKTISLLQTSDSWADSYSFHWAYFSV